MRVSLPKVPTRAQRLLAAILAVSTVALSCSSTEPSSPSLDPSPIGRPQGEGGTGEAAPETRSLVYLRDQALVRLDLGSDEEETLGTVPAPDVFPIADRADRFLLVEDKAGGEDFAQDPELSVIDDEGRTVRSLGAGFSPLVDPTGTRVVYLRSESQRVCEGEVCLGAVELRVADLNGARDEVLRTGDWHPLAWAADRLIVSGKGLAYEMTLDGELERLTVIPSEVWGVTPDGTQMVVSRRGGAEFLDLETNKSRPTQVDGALAEGEWNSDGDELVAVVIDGARTELVRLSVADGSVAPVPDSRGAMGPVLRGPEDSFAYVRSAGLKLEAVVCDEGDGCRPVLTWAEGLLPLALD